MSTGIKKDEGKHASVFSFSRILHGFQEFIHQSEQLIHVAHIDFAHVRDAVGLALQIPIAIRDSQSLRFQEFI